MNSSLRNTRTYIVFRLSRLNISQTKMAERTGCTFTALNQTINGKKTYPLVQLKLAQELGYKDWNALTIAANKFSTDIEHIYLTLSKTNKEE